MCYSVTKAMIVSVVGTAMTYCAEALAMMALMVVRVTTSRMVEMATIGLVEMTIRLAQTSLSAVQVSMSTDLEAPMVW